LRWTFPFNGNSSCVLKVTTVFVKAGFNLPFLFYEILCGTCILFHTYEYQLTTLGILGWTDFFPEYPVHTYDLTIALLNFQILKIMLFQHIDDTFARMYPFQSFDDIDLAIFDDQLNG
tara:strand:- start:117 stop:470 length:354 start_codon:yes stop_codon:yes gene_type:complete